MPIILHGRRVIGDPMLDLARLEALVTDFQAITDGGLPAPDTLAAAPLLDHWRVATLEVPCLVGFTTDHPGLNGPTIQTSDVWIHAPDLGWTRTLSRFYRLGRPADEEALS